MQKKILVVLLMLLLLSASYPAKPESNKQKNVKVVEGPKGQNESDCGYFLDGVWHGYECCSDAECEKGDVCIDHECVKLECAGDVNLNLEVVEGKIRAEVKGIENCDGKTVRIRNGSCDGQEVCSFVWSAAECYFNVPPPGTYEYFACVDMNGNGEYSSDETDAEKLFVMLYGPENKTTDKNQTSAGRQTDAENEESPWEVCVPLGLFVVVLAIILLPWVHETWGERKKKTGSRKRKI